MTDKGSYPYETTGKIIILYILNFNNLDWALFGIQEEFKFISEL
jgi:hypothetical protein